MLNSADRLAELLEKVQDELVVFDRDVKNVRLQTKENKEMSEKLLNLQSEVDQKTSKHIEEVKRVDERDKALTKKENLLKAKEIKINTEWERMIEEKQRLAQVVEENAKEKLRLERLEEKITSNQVEQETKEKIMKQKEKAMAELQQRNKVRDKLVKEKQSKVENYLKSLEE